MSSAPDKLRQRIAELAEMVGKPKPEMHKATAAELVWQIRRFEAFLGVDNDFHCEIALAPTNPEERDRQWGERRERRMAVRQEIQLKRGKQDERDEDVKNWQEKGAKGNKAKGDKTRDAIRALWPKVLDLPKHQRANRLRYLLARRSDPIKITLCTIRKHLREIGRE